MENTDLLKQFETKIREIYHLKNSEEK
jgi:hypothetical protein